jgi:hypothetical protein
MAVPMWHAPIGLDAIDKRATCILHGQGYKGDLSCGLECGRKGHMLSPWSWYISVSMLTASESKARFGLSTTPRAYNWCPRARLPNTNCAALVRSRQSTQLVLQIPFCRSILLRQTGLLFHQHLSKESAGKKFITSLDYTRSENTVQGRSGRNRLFVWILLPGLPGN